MIQIKSFLLGLFICRFDAVNAAQDMGGLPFTGLPRLNKTHYSWPLYDDPDLTGNDYDLNDENFLQYVRITGSCPFRLDFISPDHNKQSQLVACVTACKIYDAVVSFTYSPYLDFYFNAGQCSSTGANFGHCPAPTQADIDTEVENLRSYLEAVRGVLDTENIAQETCVQATTMFFDQETWGGDMAGSSMVVAALTSAYNEVREVFPSMDLTWYNRGAWEAYPFCNINTEACWVNDGTASMEKGHNVGVSMYFPGCVDTMDALWARNTKEAQSEGSIDGLPMSFTPYISLGCGWGELTGPDSCSGNFGVWNWTWNYATALSWRYGGDVNQYSGDTPDPSWAAPLVPVLPYLYPAPLNSRSGFVDDPVLGFTRATWLHFAAYVMGASGLTEFPTGIAPVPPRIPACPHPHPSSAPTKSGAGSFNAGPVVGAVFLSLVGLALLAGVAFVAITRPPWAEAHLFKLESSFQKDSGGSKHGYQANTGQSPLLDGEQFN